ncbi:MAG TPA: TonB family protein [Pyrinomonadaceae bacterium]|jgi:TonB family protein|nr:TonB family protein [Pyrinomonadaceae bacterium]
MFNNLIESSSHAREFKRRGTFVLFATATYALLFVVAGVISIYAYDARLDDQNTEIVTMLNPVDLPAAPVTTAHSAPPRSNNNRPTEVVRQAPIASMDHPEIVPTTTSVTPNKNLPVPDHGPWRIGPQDSGPVDPGGPGNSTGDGNSTGNNKTGPAVVEIITPPPPPPPPPPVKPPPVISKGVITGLALALPKPVYPQIAKQARAAGAVNVQVLIDENGKVISAKAVGGHPMLLAAAQQAAYGARFSPTKLGEQAVKVSGMITYNFVLQ